MGSLKQMTKASAGHGGPSLPPEDLIIFHEYSLHTKSNNLPHYNPIEANIG